MTTRKIPLGIFFLIAASAVIVYSAAVIEKRDAKIQTKDLLVMGNKKRKEYEESVKKEGGTLKFPPLVYDNDLAKTAEGLVDDCSKWKHGSDYRFFPLIQGLAMKIEVSGTIQEREKKYPKFFERVSTMFETELTNPAAKTLGCAIGGSCSFAPPGDTDKTLAKGICLVGTTAPKGSNASHFSIDLGFLIFFIFMSQICIFHF